jgi:hypothetical protein
MLLQRIGFKYLSWVYMTYRYLAKGVNNIATLILIFEAGDSVGKLCQWSVQGHTRATAVALFACTSDRHAESVTLQLISPVFCKKGTTLPLYCKLTI